MNQHDFDILLQKYLAGESSEDEDKLVTEWSVSRLETSKVPLNAEEQRVIQKKLWKRIRSSIAPTNPFSMRFSWLRFSIAASLLVATIGLLYLNKTMFSKDTKSSASLTITHQETTGSFTHYKEIKNTGKHPQKLALEDGSTVILQPGSQLNYPPHFTTKVRRVYLLGEAFFSVSKNPSKPFIVHTGELVTQVLGTSFNVKSYSESESIEVQVITGRVSVYENTPKSPANRNGVILHPNEKIIFDKESKKLLPKLVDDPVIVNQPESRKQFVFDETLLSKVVSTIQQAYGIEIVLETPALESCTFTGDINDLPLHTQLKFICKSINASYELRGTTFFIQGEGCMH